MQCNAMQCYVILCYVTVCHVMLCCICMYMYACDICPCCIHHHWIMRVYTDMFDSQKWCLQITVDTSHGRFDQPWPKWQPGSAFLQLMLLQPEKNNQLGSVGTWSVSFLDGSATAQKVGIDSDEGRLATGACLWLVTHVKAQENGDLMWFVHKNPIRSQKKRGFLQ